MSCLFCVFRPEMALITAKMDETGRIIPNTYETREDNLSLLTGVRFL